MVSNFESYQQNLLPAIRIKKNIVNRGIDNFKRSSTISWLFSDSIEMTNSRKVGCLFLVVIFGVILSPSAMSSSDPYHLQEYIKKFQDFWLSLENMFTTKDFNHSDDTSNDYELIDSTRYKVLLNLELDIKNPDGGRYIIPGFNEIIKGKKF